jgi:hypothetical protein
VKLKDLPESCRQREIRADFNSGKVYFLLRHPCWGGETPVLHPYDESQEAVVDEFLQQRFHTTTYKHFGPEKMSSVLSTTTIPGGSNITRHDMSPRRKECQSSSTKIPFFLVVTDNSSTKQKQDSAFRKIKKEGTRTRG